MCGSEIKEPDIEEFWFALLGNKTLLVFNFDEDEDAHENLALISLKCELELNREIKHEILPNLRLDRSGPTTTGGLSKIDLSNQDFNYVEALVKFAKLHNTTSLNLRKTNLSHDQLQTLVSSVVEHNLAIESYDLSANDKIDDTCA